MYGAVRQQWTLTDTALSIEALQRLQRGENVKIALSMDEWQFEKLGALRRGVVWGRLAVYLEIQHI